MKSTDLEAIAAKARDGDHTEGFLLIVDDDGETLRHQDGRAWQKHHDHKTWREVSGDTSA